MSGVKETRVRLELIRVITDITDIADHLPSLIFMNYAAEKSVHDTSTLVKLD